MVLVGALLCGWQAAAADVAAVTRIFRTPRYERGRLNQVVCQPVDEAAWIWHPDVTDSPAFVRFRREFDSDGTPFEIDVSADERFVLFLDGRFVTRGPNRGWTENWQYQTYKVEVASGRHAFEAVVLRLGTSAPITQMSYRGGFVLKASDGYDAKLTTGKAAWQVGRLSGTSVGSKFVGHGAMGGRATSVGVGFEDERPAEWKVAALVAQPIKITPQRFDWGLRRPGWMLYPSEIPDQIERRQTPGAFKSGPIDLLSPLMEGKSVTVAAGTKLTACWDLQNYFCYYPEIRVSGGKGSRIVLHAAEALVDAEGKKGRRDTCVGKTINPHYDMYDTFISDGRSSARFTTPWWRCGRWIVLEIETGDEPLTIESLDILESRYPCELQSAFVASPDASFEAIQRICLRAMQCCNHEMLMDCPFYE